MRILRIISSINPRGGGPVEGLIQSSRVLLEMGHETEILSVDDECAYYISTCPIPIHAKGPGKGNYGFNRKLKLWLDNHCNKYDAIIIHGLWQYHGFAAHSVLTRRKKPYYIFTHGMLDPWFRQQYRLKHFKKWLYWPWAEYRVLRDAKKVFFTSEEERIRARESFWLYRCNETVVNYGTAGQAGDATYQKSEFLRAFPHLKGKPYLLFLSRIHPKKGVDILLDAFVASLNLQFDLKLVIAGPDQTGWQQELEKHVLRMNIADRVTWTGMLKGDLKWGAYLNAQAFILPSHQENFGIVVAEALSCGIPVLISDKINIWREVRDEEAGLVENDTQAGCINLIRRWVAINEDERRSMIVNARKCFNKHFEIHQAANNLLKELEI